MLIYKYVEINSHMHVYIDAYMRIYNGESSFEDLKRNAAYNPALFTKPFVSSFAYA